MAHRRADVTAYDFDPRGVHPREYNRGYSVNGFAGPIPCPQCGYRAHDFDSECLLNPWRFEPNPTGVSRKGDSND